MPISVVIYPHESHQQLLVHGTYAKERCSVDQDALNLVNSNGLLDFLTDHTHRFQGRVHVSGTQYALFSAAYAPSPDTTASGVPIVRIGPGGLSRLGISKTAAQNGVPATLDETVTFGTEFVEETVPATGTFLIAIAPHGGQIEAETDLQARRVTSNLVLQQQGVAYWGCSGLGRQGFGASTRWHITSIDISEHSLPQLRLLMGQPFTHAVAFHGFTPKPGAAPVIVGGRANQQVKQDIAEAIRALGVVVDIDGGALNARHRRNIVNRLSGGNGVQIEQSLEVRRTQGQALADAVAGVYTR